MSDIFTPEKRSEIMSKIRGKDTGPELLLKDYLEAAGFEYQPDYTAWSPDFFDAEAKVAVFVDGCFWHCCPKHGSIPKSNIDYWKPKLERNAERDNETNQKLNDEGFFVIRIWEHSVSEKTAENVAARIAKARDTYKKTNSLRGVLRI